MKFSISYDTVAACANKLEAPLPEFKGQSEYVNFSSKLIADGNGENEEWVIELNDAVLIKYIGLVVKLAKLIESALALMQTDITELAEFIITKKEQA